MRTIETGKWRWSREAMAALRAGESVSLIVRGARRVKEAEALLQDIEAPIQKSASWRQTWRMVRFGSLYVVCAYALLGTGKAMTHARVDPERLVVQFVSKGNNRVVLTF